MTKLDIIVENYPDSSLLSADGFDDAILGVHYNKQTGEYILIYSRTLCIDVLMQRDKMTHEEAEEFFEFNVEGAYMGEKTPIFVDDEALTTLPDTE
jgi:hypothetical protein